MKKILLGLSFMIGIGITKAVDLSGCELKTFNATAYYSPLPNQSYYVQGSLFNEYLLEGNGTHGASGKEVFSGMIAAPKTYDFGTQLYFSGYGMAEISDRGGAIVSIPGGNDRIDIWMGKGDEGLWRALTFGRKTLSAYICPAGTSEIDFDLTQFPSIQQKIKSLPASQAKQEVKDLFETYIDIKTDADDQLTLQLEKILAQKGLLASGYVDNSFDYYTAQSLCIYQLVNKILSSETDQACGTFGPKTRAALKVDTGNYDLLKVSKIRLAVRKEFLKRSKVQPFNTLQNAPIISGENTKISSSKNSILTGNISSQKSTNSSSSISSTTNSIKDQLFSTYMDKSSYQKDLVYLLQKYLIKLGYIKNSSGIYDNETKSAICKFQIEKKILGDNTDPLCGVWGPTTRKIFLTQIPDL